MYRMGELQGPTHSAGTCIKYPVTDWQWRRIWTYKHLTQDCRAAAREGSGAPPPSTLAWRIPQRRSLVGCRPRGREESDTTERLHFPLSLSRTGEEMAAHSSVLACRIPGTGRPGGLPSVGSQSRTRLTRLHFPFSLSCIGEGNGNPLQCSCLENPRDREAWWAAVYGVAQSWTRLKRLSSSSSSRATVLH